MTCQPKHAISGMVITLALTLLGICVRVRHPSAAPHRPLTEQEREAEQSRWVLDWLSRPAVELSSPSLITTVRDVIGRQGCLSVPTGVSTSIRSLDVAQTDDLAIAVAGLLKAYGSNDPRAVFRYMEGRDEALPPDTVANIKDTYLIPIHRVDAKELTAATDEDVFELFWNKMNSRTHWRAVAKGAGCTLIWETSEPFNRNVTDALGQPDTDLFRNRVRHHHYFAPKYDDLPTTLARDSAVLLADVKLIVCYDGERLGEPRPHFVRFWFEPTRGVWHPYDLVLAPTVDQSYPGLIF